MPALILSGAIGLDFTTQVAVKLLPSVVLQVMTAVPIPTVVILPLELTTTAFVFEEVHSSGLEAAEAGETVALNEPDFPIGQVILLVLSLRLFAEFESYTNTLQVAIRLLPSVVLQVIIAFPDDTEVSLPFESTVATDGFDDDQESFFIIASEGEMVALNEAVFPTGHFIVAALSFKDEAFLPTVTLQVAVKLLPSVVEQVMVHVPKPTAVSLPEEDTLATARLDDSQASFVFLGYTFGLKYPDFPMGHLMEFVFKTNEGFLTVTLQVALKLLPSVVVQVIVHIPAETAVSLPVDDTVATVSSEDSHISCLFTAYLGTKLGLKLPAFPTGQSIVFTFKYKEDILSV